MPSGQKAAKPRAGTVQLPKPAILRSHRKLDAVDQFSPLSGIPSAGRCCDTCLVLLSILKSMKSRCAGLGQPIQQPTGADMQGDASGRIKRPSGRVQCAVQAPHSRAVCWVSHALTARFIKVNHERQEEARHQPPTQAGEKGHGGGILRLPETEQPHQPGPGPKRGGTAELLAGPFLRGFSS